MTLSCLILKIYTALYSCFYNGVMHHSFAFHNSANEFTSKIVIRNIDIIVPDVIVITECGLN